MFFDIPKAFLLNNSLALIKEMTYPKGLFIPDIIFNTIYYPQSTNDVVDLLKLSRFNGCTIAVQSGGHSYCPLIAGILIDIANFNLF